MILFFKSASAKIYVVSCQQNPVPQDIKKLTWLFGNATPLEDSSLSGGFIGPRREMITPWSTNAVEITQNMGIDGIERIEEFYEVGDDAKAHDPMLQSYYPQLDQQVFTIDKQPDPIQFIENIGIYNRQEGLALSDDEVEYLEEVSKKLGRKLTDSEVFGFSQVNSEHCRHKIFNGTFIIDGEEKPDSLFQLIKKTSQQNHNQLVSAYKDNVAFTEGPVAEQFAPKYQDRADYFETGAFKSVISLKAETHNFPTTVEPFNGAATGSGGEIRDRLAGGKGSIPLAGTAVYMTPYSRLAGGRDWEKKTSARPWLYQTPIEILIKASNGASDFGNKFGQPLICGSLLTFEHFEDDKKYGFDKVIMLAGGIGFGKFDDSLKATPEKGDKIVILGGDNYRIGMGGGAVSSVATGEFDNAIELNAVQRSNPEMQKRVANAIRALTEMSKNPIVSIHDHGAGGHLNCLSELVEETGGVIDVEKLPLGDPTLSDKEIIGNESQERMGLIVKEEDVPLLQKIAERERAPFYVVGEVSGDLRLTFTDNRSENNPVDWQLEHMFGKPPKTVLNDHKIAPSFADVSYHPQHIHDYVEQLLQLESVASKDWLTNKVDRCVSGKVAKQQTAGELQLPLNNVAVMTIDFRGDNGIATSIGHAPVSALIDPAAGSRLSIAEALTNIIWAPLDGGIKAISLSANWMWPAKNPGEDARLYEAVAATSEFACALGINIPTGKDSLSMTQKYNDDEVVRAPGTVIISACAPVQRLSKIVEPVLKPLENTILMYIDFSRDQFKLGGSSFSQIRNEIGKAAPTVVDATYFLQAFNTVQELIKDDHILSGHDISAGGLLTTLLEMNFPNQKGGVSVSLDEMGDEDIVKILFSEKPGIVIQVASDGPAAERLKAAGLTFHVLGSPIKDRKLTVQKSGTNIQFDIDKLRDLWYKTSYLLDCEQTNDGFAASRYDNYGKQPLKFTFPQTFTGSFDSLEISPDRKHNSGIKAAIIREKGVNGDREMAYAMHLAGFDVKDIHMTDLISGRENLQDVNFIAFVGGFSNSDVLGSAKGWAGAFLFNEKAKQALDDFYARKDTLSLGVCNGCQLMMELGLLYPQMENHPTMHHNTSGKFECSFLNIDVPENNSVMLGSLSGTRLGIWVAHGEGRFILPDSESDYHISAKYSYDAYPGNPNGSDFSVASLHSADGRHLAIMPHLERSIFPWNWAHYPEGRNTEQVSPWIEAFMNARKWVKEHSDMQKVKL
ncbi:phosphoribosylformylglycinamidine synthase [Fulvivirgaceae bacterium BMA12]|uniref:Phosphoribosylformylglycinamidine synthase n=1 Tax=Agaribacillus aureus TaxID=3051825 RepID=A0ABT8L1D6_9BACT|nr:phosphoribosylformylglycinamidine synthase [Fulvivirgaceae bacterium BMA12]